MSSNASGGSSAPKKPLRTFYQIADRLEAMAQALKSLSDPSIKRHIIDEMRTLLAEIEQQL
jgi:hypothetical protein